MGWETALGFGLLLVLGGVLLRQIKPEFAYLFLVASGLWLLFGTLSQMAAIRQAADVLLALSDGLEDDAALLWKSVLLAIVTTFAADAAADAGEQALARQIEFVGQVALILLSLPLFQSVSVLVLSLFG